MRKFHFLLLVTCFVMSYSYGQDSTSFNVKYKLRGNMYVKSSIIDSTAFGGFGGSSNTPKVYSDTLNLRGEGVYLYLDTTKTTTVYKQYEGYKFYIVNLSDSILKLSASDSRISCVAEVLYNGEWKKIEYLPSSGCGNSYHKVFLDNNQYWEFDVPKFNGTEPVQLRYKLALGGGKYLYSNAIHASINKEQFGTKQGYKPNGIMDPYKD
ncbi:hypothetical protein SAMN05216474_0045 [Lishizhenia tianjinensis]|uniref:Uncharacterized protein n=1 Tax=Lishizhenia tianjinensis TaxID=477690 RepID=A0A1I6XA25_9FLAO|nr:hypothetical protein [Lishizhenia tianjinensis]SFT35155.1 hypothetical protein SAMN05216474_0045 [Lishizhenia tianjinensis]